MRNPNRKDGECELAGQGLNRTHLPTGAARRTTTDKTNAGRGILAKDPRSNGSLGIAISEAVEDAATHDDTKYSLGSVLNHVCMHQTVIGLEAQEQMKLAGEYPDVVIACHGGGSNFSGIALPFVRDKMNGHAIKAAVDEAKKADAEGKSRVILFNLSGHGHFDLGAYDQYFAGKLEDFEYPREAVERSMANLPRVEV